MADIAKLRRAVEAAEARTHQAIEGVRTAKAELDAARTAENEANRALIRAETEEELAHG